MTPLQQERARLRARAAELYRQGLSSNQIAHEMDLSQPTICRYLQREQVEIRRPTDGLYDEDGNKRCARCREYLPISSYYEWVASDRGRTVSSYCRQCMSEHSREQNRRRRQLERKKHATQIQSRIEDQARAIQLLSQALEILANPMYRGGPDRDIVHRIQAYLRHRDS